MGGHGSAALFPYTSRSVSLNRATLMKFRFPIVIIDEDYRSENTSGLGIRALAQAIEAEGFEVLGVTSYGSRGPALSSCPSTTKSSPPGPTSTPSC